MPNAGLGRRRAGIPAACCRNHVAARPARPRWRSRGRRRIEGSGFAPGSHRGYPVSNMVGHPKPGEVMRRARTPTWRANYRCSISPDSKFVRASLFRMVMKGFDTRIYTGLGRMSLCPVQALALLHSKFAVGVTNGRERERGSQVSS